MAFDIVIADGRVVTATDTYTGDVAISNGKIAAIGQNELRQNAARVIDAAGKYVLPGGIDVHTHLDMPFGGTTSSDDFETGTRAAAFGGTTTLIDFAIQYKGQPLRKAFDTWIEKASRKAVCDYSFHCIVTDLTGDQLNEMNALVDEGVTSFKLFMAYPGVFMLDDASIFKALRQTADNGGLVCMHAENGGAIDVLVQQALSEGKKAPKYHALTRPTTAEAEATARAIALAEMAGAPVYIVHLSCHDALEKVREARDRGLPVYAETCPQYLYLSIENFDVPGFEGAKFVFTPPLREKWNQEKLWNGLKRDHLQVVSTDHCPFCIKEQKELGREDFTKIPNGGPGIEHRMSLIYSGGVKGGRFSVNRFVELVSTTPAKLFGLYPRKGTIGLGSDADLVIFDPNRKHTISAKTHHMRVDYSMFEGIEVTGVAETVLSQGRLIVDGNQFLGQPGRGTFVKRSTYSPP
ncbi:MAG: dihydropyrimidinase [Acidobacteria bacterium]|nr:dihydropyrimidinase [Acidobacteriota bacterium]MBV9623859.1 dihydropyrimidinase [Acidobacteriota bacterium]